MPNWCRNNMEITGSIDEITRFKQTCIRTVFEGEQAQLDFKAIIPMPDFPADDGVTWPACLEWASKHWGTKWNACGFHEPDRYECVFSTAWSPPSGVWEKLGAMFPALDFSLSGCEPNMDFAFKGTIRGGKLELLNVPLIWETVDPKTGETISGTREDVEAVLGKHGGTVSVRAGEASS
jgi:Ferredoxin-like domain in Api92-like protein